MTYAHPGHVSLWHPWYDKSGLRHDLHLFSEYASLTPEEMIAAIGDSKYAFCEDILQDKEVPEILLRSDKSEAYLSRTGSIAALRIRNKRKSGFLIPGIQWGCETAPAQDLIEIVSHIFRKFNLEALTPASLSEKILRRTLPAKTYINRPSMMLRASLLANKRGGRIQSKNGRWYVGYENDINKAYPFIAAQGVPTPFLSPMRFVAGSNMWDSKPVSWLEATLTAHGSGLQPVQIQDVNGLREPCEGETFTQYMWSGEMFDCIEAGYTLHSTGDGWSWNTLDRFMEPWADIMYDAYMEEENTWARNILKTMMVGLPGRFLKAPEVYTLIHRSEARKDDIPILSQWQSGDSPFSNWYMRVDTESEKARETAQLTPIGSFIIAECRRKIYHDSKREESNGNVVIRLYIDSLVTTSQATTLDNGKKRGQYKIKIYHEVGIHRNRFTGTTEQGELITKIPGVVKSKHTKELEKWLDSS